MHYIQALMRNGWFWLVVGPIMLLVLLVVVFGGDDERAPNPKPKPTPVKTNPNIPSPSVQVDPVAVSEATNIEKTAVDADSVAFVNWPDRGRVVRLSAQMADALMTTQPQSATATLDKWSPYLSEFGKVIFSELISPNDHSARVNKTTFRLQNVLASNHPQTGERVVAVYGERTYPLYAPTDENKQVGTNTSAVTIQLIWLNDETKVGSIIID